MSIRKTVLATLAMALTCSAQATTLNFDALGDDVQVTNQFPEATFSGSGAHGVYTISADFGSSLPNVIASGPSYGVGTSNMTMTFTNPVNGLTYVIVGDNTNGVVGLVDVFVGGVFSATISMIADGNGATADLIDLSAFTGVTSLFMHTITDSGGIGYDDFNFAVQAVPEPATLALTGLALAGLAWSRRRKLLAG